MCPHLYPSLRFHVIHSQYLHCTKSTCTLIYYTIHKMITNVELAFAFRLVCRMFLLRTNHSVILCTSKLISAIVVAMKGNEMDVLLLAGSVGLRISFLLYS